MSAEHDHNACWEGSLHLAMGKHGSQYKPYFISLKPVLGFQTSTLATLGKWATIHGRVVFLGQELLLDFAACIDLTSNADTTIAVYQLP